MASEGTPLHMQPDPGPRYEQVRLGDDVIEVDSETAAKIRSSYETLAAQYGAALEDVQRRTLASIGMPAPGQAALPPPPPGLDVPDPDLLFQNKQAWTDEFGRSLQQQIGSVRGEATQLVQGAVQAFQAELNRRDQIQQAKQLHDRAMDEMLERRGLTENTVLVQAIYNRDYEKLKHLPLELALDKIGQESQAEIERIRAGEQWTITPGAATQGMAPRAPVQHLRSARRASTPPPAPAQSEGLQDPGGGLGLLGRMIRQRQAKTLGGSAA